MPEVAEPAVPDFASKAKALVADETPDFVSMAESLAQEEAPDFAASAKALIDEENKARMEAKAWEFAKRKEQDQAIYQAAEDAALDRQISPFIPFHGAEEALREQEKGWVDVLGDNPAGWAAGAGFGTATYAMSGLAPVGAGAKHTLQQPAALINLAIGEEETAHKQAYGDELIPGLKPSEYEGDMGTVINFLTDLGVQAAQDPLNTAMLVAGGGEALIGGVGRVAGRKGTIMPKQVKAIGRIIGEDVANKAYLDGLRKGAEAAGRSPIYGPKPSGELMKVGPKAEMPTPLAAMEPRDVAAEITKIAQREGIEAPGAKIEEAAKPVEEIKVTSSEVKPVEPPVEPVAPAAPVEEPVAPAVEAKPVTEPAGVPPVAEQPAAEPARGAELAGQKPANVLASPRGYRDAIDDLPESDTPTVKPAAPAEGTRPLGGVDQGGGRDVSADIGSRRGGGIFGGTAPEGIAGKLRSALSAIGFDLSEEGVLSRVATSGSKRVVEFGHDAIKQLLKGREYFKGLTGSAREAALANLQRIVADHELIHASLMKSWIDEWEAAGGKGSFSRFRNAKAREVYADVKTSINDMRLAGNEQAAAAAEQALYDSWNIYRQRTAELVEGGGTAREGKGVSTPADLMRLLETNPEKVPNFLFEFLRQLKEVKDSGITSEMSWRNLVAKVTQYLKDALGRLERAGEMVRKGELGEKIQTALEQQERGYETAKRGAERAGEAKGPKIDPMDLEPDVDELNRRMDEAAAGEGDEVGFAAEAEGKNVSTNDKGILAALTNPTVLSKQKGNIRGDYPVNFRGTVYPDAEAAYKANIKVRGPTPENIALMTDIIAAKLQQHPILGRLIEKNGGQAWLENLSHRVTGGPWEGDGVKSPFIRALSDAYKKISAPSEGRGVVRRIISGGQSGADMAGLEAGKELGLETGGTAPPGWIQHDELGIKGNQQQKLSGYGLQEGEADPSIFRKRTIKNAQDADGTVWFGRADSPGGRLTLGRDAQSGKPPPLINPTAQELAAWVKKHNIQTLNVAGNREYTNRGITQKAKNVLREGLSGEKPSSQSELWRIEAPHFVAGIEVKNGTVTNAAPIAKWMVGKTLKQVQEYTANKKWKMEPTSRSGDEVGFAAESEKPLAPGDEWQDVPEETPEAIAKAKVDIAAEELKAEKVAGPRLENFWKRMLKGGQPLWQNALQPLIKQGGVLRDLAKRVIEAKDEAESMGGKLGDILQKAYDGASQHGNTMLQKSLDEFRTYMQTRETNRVVKMPGREIPPGLLEKERQGFLLSEDLYKRMSPGGRLLVDAVKEVARQTSEAERTIGVKVVDAVTRKIRPAGSYGEWYWPKVLTENVRKILADPVKHIEEYKKLMEQALAKNPDMSIQDLKNLANEAIKHDMEGPWRHSAVDYARTNYLPGDWYEYGFEEVMPTHVQKTAQRLAHINHYGQAFNEPGQPRMYDAFDRVIRLVSDTDTKRYLEVMRDVVRGNHPNTAMTRLMSNARAFVLVTKLATGMAAVKNLSSIVMNTTPRYGFNASARAAFKMMRNYGEEMRKAQQAGALRHDITTSMAEVWDLNRAARETVGGALKATGFTMTENINRIHAASTATAWARWAIKKIEQNPHSRAARQSMAIFQEQGINWRLLKQEGMEGAQASRLRRTAVNRTQFSYDIRQVPLWMESPMAKFLFQFQKFSIQQMNMFMNDIVAPMVVGREYKLPNGKTAKIRDFKPFMYAMLGATGFGEILLTGVKPLFNRDRQDANWTEIHNAFNEQDDRSIGMFLNHLGHNILEVGLTGSLGNIYTMGEDFVQRGREYDILNPPATGLLQNAWDNVAQATWQQGDMTMTDVKKFMLREFPALNYGIGLTEKLGGFEYAQRERSLRNMRRLGFQYADEADLEKGATAVQYAKTPMTPFFTRLQKQLLNGDVEGGRETVQEILSRAKNNAERKKLQKSIISSINARRPMKVGAIDTEDERADFAGFIQRRAGDEVFEELRQLEKTYVDTAKQVTRIKISAKAFNRAGGRTERLNQQLQSSLYQ